MNLINEDAESVRGTHRRSAVSPWVLKEMNSLRAPILGGGPCAEGPLQTRGGPGRDAATLGQRHRPIGMGTVARTLATGVILAIPGMPASAGAIDGEAPHETDIALRPAKLEWATSFRWENDTFGGTDRFYTDGVSLAVSHTGPSWMDPVADWLPWGEGRRTVGYDVGQAMFTPSDKDLAVPDPEDRPYAGILAIGLALHVEKEDSYHGLKFVTGVVGPSSLAEETQNAVHDCIGNDKSQGWDYQLEDEPIFNLAYEYRHRFLLSGEPERWSAQAFPLGGAWLGNMLIQGQAGGVIRFGFNMPDDFGPTLVRGLGHMPPPRWDRKSAAKSGWGFSVHGGGVVNLVLRDITLDGNTFKDSASVDKEFFVPAAGLGVAVGNRRFQASFSYVFWGSEFEGQDDNSEFGSLAFAYLF